MALMKRRAGEESRMIGRGIRRRAITGLLLGGAVVFLAAAAPPAPGTEAPDFTLNDLSGAAVRLSELRGEMVVLHFWATWCPHCRTEMPILAEMERDAKTRHLRILAVNLGESPRRVRRYLEENRLSLTVLMDGKGKAAQRYAVTGLPATILVDPSGRILRQMSMGSLDRKEIEATADSYLGAAK
jgi:peroxiredoxin